MENTINTIDEEEKPEVNDKILKLLNTITDNLTEKISDEEALLDYIFQYLLSNNLSNSFLSTEIIANSQLNPQWNDTQTIRYTIKKLVEETEYNNLLNKLDITPSNKSPKSLAKTFQNLISAIYKPPRKKLNDILNNKPALLEFFKGNKTFDRLFLFTGFQEAFIKALNDVLKEPENSEFSASKILDITIFKLFNVKHIKDLESWDDNDISDYIALKILLN